MEFLLNLFSKLGSILKLAGHLSDQHNEENAGQQMPEPSSGSTSTAPLIWDADTEAFIRKFVSELRDENAAAFIGAGLSKQAGYVDWAQLLEQVAKDIGLDSHREPNLVALAQFHVNANGNQRAELNQLLIDRFADVAIPTENHRILSRLPISTFWTTNYDRLLETALQENGKRYDSKYTDDHLTLTKKGRDVVLYKMHGDIEHPNQAVLIRHDYEEYHVKHAPFLTALAGDLVSKTFLFLGFSFSDPNLDYVLSRLRIHFGTAQRQHYCIMKKRTRNDKEPDDTFAYEATRQEHQLADLRRFNIKPILVSEYSQITDLLAVIEQRFRLRSVFVSGSAVDFGPWGQAKSEHFLIKLAGILVERGFRIVTGFGLGIGGAVVAGALDQIYAKEGRSIEDQLVMRPFPISSGEQPETLDRYRRDLISAAGIAIFFIGNKADGSNVINADGMRTEFELARQNRLIAIPIGSSGFMAKELWTEVMSDMKAYFPSDEAVVRPLLERLGQPCDDPVDLLDPLLALLSHLTKE